MFFMPKDQTASAWSQLSCAALAASLSFLLFTAHSFFAKLLLAHDDLLVVVLVVLHFLLDRPQQVDAAARAIALRLH